MIGIIDYDAGDLRGVEKVLISLEEAPVITRDRESTLEANWVILPGADSFGGTMSRLRQHGLVDVIRETMDKGTPFLGICLGLQLLFESNEESEGVEDLGILSGRTLRIPDTPGLKIPHMGWNSLDIKPGAMLFRGTDNGTYVHLVHSYYLKANDEHVVAASTEYSTHVHAAIKKGHVFACQFYPEKSSQVGLSILKNFLEVQMYPKVVGESHVYKENCPMSGCE